MTVKEARARLRKIETTHKRTARQSPLFKPALEFVRSFGTLGLDVLQARWASEVERQEREYGDG